MAFRLLSAIKNQHFHSLMGNVISAFFNVLSFAILVRILPGSEFGEWVLFVATFNIMDQIRTALLQSGLIRFYAGETLEKGKKVLGAAWYIALSLSFLYLGGCLLAMTLIPGLDTGTWKHFMWWIGPMLLLALPFNFASWVLQASHRFDKIVQLRIVQNGCFLLFIATLYFIRQVSLLNILYAYTAALAITSVYSFIFRWTYIRSVVFRTKQQIRDLVIYGRLIVGSMVTSGFINYSDSFLIRTMINPAAVAIYSIPQKFMEVIEIILRSFVATAQPTLSSAVNRNNWKEVAHAFSRYTGAVTILILPFIIGMLILVQPLIIILADKTYLSATDIVVIFLLSAILYPIDRFIGVTLDMINKPHINFYKNFLKLFINIVGDIAFILLFKDLWAVAAVSFLNLIAGVAFGYYFLKKYVDFTLKDTFLLGWQESKMLIMKILLKIKLVKVQ